MYQEGQGLQQDSVEAYLWVSLAASRAIGDDRRRYSDEAALIGAGIASAQVAEVQRLVSAWKPNWARASSI
jgi:hypothetical protein